MKEISLIAATFYGNRGAEGMLSATIGELRARHGAALRFNVFSYYPKRDRELVTDPHVAIYSSTPLYLVTVLLPLALVFRLMSLPVLRRCRAWLPDSVRALGNSEVLICLAGVSFVEGRAKFLPFNVATILPAMVLAVPVVKFAQAMGPFRSRLNRWVSKVFLGRCARVFSRGDRTQDHLRTLLGASSNYARADDIAFLFRPEYCLSVPALGLEASLTRLRNFQADGQEVVGVCPSIVVAKRARADGWDYAQRIGDLIIALVGRGHTVALYPNATRGADMDKEHNNDLPLLEAVESRLPESVLARVVRFSGSLNASQIHTIVNACDAHIVSRFHAMVAALSSCVPVMVIGWSHKYLEVMERFGQEDMVIDYSEGGFDAVVQSMDKLLAQREERVRIIESALPSVRALAQRQVEYILGMLNDDEYPEPH